MAIKSTQNGAQSEKDDDDGRIKMFFGRPLQGQIVPVRVEVNSWIGKVVGRLDLRKMTVQ